MSKPDQPSGRLCLETGEVFDGVLFGSDPGHGHAWGEIVFNTCMTGYQEIASDPSYAGQMVVMTYPMIGNYGCRDDAMESSRFHLRALVVRQLSPTPIRASAERTLVAELEAHDIPCLSGVDTRALTRRIRSHGSVRAVLARADAMSAEEQIALVRRTPTVSDQDLVAQVSQPEPWKHWSGALPPELDWPVTHAIRADRFRGCVVVCLDLGVKRNQLRALASRGVHVVTVRHDSTLEDILALKPDGIVLSNGPGDPASLPAQVEVVRRAIETGIPLLGICLGHQVLARAIGGSTSRLPFGHHGGNHPVRNERTANVYITAQNHEFQVDASSIRAGSGWYVSERNLNDDSVEGLRHESLPAFSVQYHPEGGPGPQDCARVFDEFLEMVAVRRWAKQGDPGFVAAVEMPQAERRKPPASVLVIGSGPVVIGQAAEFDYAGTQACRALREDGVRVILVNSNPATIMTDDESADAVYIEPLTVPVLERIIARERPDGLLATLGGQTGLNLAMALEEAGVLKRYDVQVLGTSLDAIHLAEDRERFKQLLLSIGEPVPASLTVENVADAKVFRAVEGLPLVVRPAFTLGGTGGGIAETDERFAHIVAAGLAASPISQVLVERSLVGWREIEYEVVRDAKGTSITVCNMENMDPMGVHTGDSIVVAPSQTLTDREHQQLRGAALRIINALQIEGGCNVQFALAPDSHEYFVIEVNPRVSRSSALASKATGYPIARVAAKIALGKHLDEIPNAITGRTTAAFEPALDYCVVKIPRWPFDKFPGGDRRLGTQMKSTGEVMAIERTFEAALSKAIRSLEQPIADAGSLHDPVLIRVANDRRIFAILEALRRGINPDDIARDSGINPWFVHRIKAMVTTEESLKDAGLSQLTLREAKQSGLSDATIAELCGVTEVEVLGARRALELVPSYKCVDTCAAEFQALTPYYYSTFETETEIEPLGDGGVVVLGSGPIRIGQGIEFDYCSVQAAQTLKRDGLAAIMINSNPETVSTDFDCSSRLYFEPLDVESTAAVIEAEAARGVMVQFGGQTAIGLAHPLATRGIRILGTSVDGVHLAEDRSRFDALLRQLDIERPEGAATLDVDEARAIADRVGYPVLVRPSFVLGGRGMEIVHTPDQVMAYMHQALANVPDTGAANRGAILIDRYLAGTEIDVDAVCDGEMAVIPGLMEHIERAGVHSGDSMAMYPAAIGDELTGQIVEITESIARAIGVRGLCNVQFVIHDGRPFVIEVNPRASRTVPFIAKVTGVPIVEMATRVAGGQRLSTMGWTSGLQPARPLAAVKAPVFSTVKLDLVDSALGPEMKSTGEVMGIDVEVAAAIEKAFLGTLGRVPLSGAALCSIADADKQEALPILRRLSELGFALYATAGTSTLLHSAGIGAVPVGRIAQSRPSVIDVIDDGTVSLVVNTVSRLDGGHVPVQIGGAADQTLRDGYYIRDAAERHRIPCCTSLDTAAAFVDAIGRHAAGIDFNISPVSSYRDGSVARLKPQSRAVPTT